MLYDRLAIRTERRFVDLTTYSVLVFYGTSYPYQSGPKINQKKSLSSIDSRIRLCSTASSSGLVPVKTQFQISICICFCLGSVPNRFVLTCGGRCLPARLGMSPDRTRLHVKTYQLTSRHSTSPNPALHHNIPNHVTPHHNNDKK